MAFRSLYRAAESLEQFALLANMGMLSLDRTKVGMPERRVLELLEHPKLHERVVKMVDRLYALTAAIEMLNEGRL